MQRIMIVDDQRDVRQVLRAGLETLSPRVQVVDVPSGEEAMLILAGQSFDLLVVDVRLPGISGLELRAWAQVKNPSLKLIVITGMTDPKMRQQVMDSPVDAYFFKPLQIGEFLDTVETLLGRKPAAGEREKTAEPVRPVQARQAESRLDAQSVKSAPGAIIYSVHDPEAKRRQQAQPPETMATRISRLRQELEAVSVVIVDERGQVVVRTGGLPDAGMENSLFQSLVISVSLSARISRLLGREKPASLSVYRGADVELWVLPLGGSWALAAAVPAVEGVDQERLGKFAACLQDAAQVLLSILGEAQIPEQAEILPEVTPSEPEPEEPQGMPGLPDVDALFRQAAEIQNQDVDVFWETLAEDPLEKPVQPDGLSYDQALRLGFAPQAPEES